MSVKRAVLVRHVPGMLEQLIARHDFTRSAHEELKHCQLLVRQRYFHPTTPSLLRRGIKTQVIHLENRGAFRDSAADDRAQTRAQLGDRKRLGHVVVGPRVKPDNPILDRVASRQHQYRSPDAIGPQAGARLEAIEAGQHHVEHDRVVAGSLRHPERVLARRRQIGCVAALAQPSSQQAAKLRIVLNHKDAHNPRVPTQPEPNVNSQRPT